MPTAQFKTQDTPYGKRYLPHNPFAKEFLWDFDLMHVTEAGMRRLEKAMHVELVK